MSGGAGDQSGAKGLSSMMGQNPNMVQPMVQNVTPLKPVLSGNGLSQAQASGANQFSGGKGQSDGGQAPVTGFGGPVGTMMNGANNFASNYTPLQSTPTQSTGKGQGGGSPQLMAVQPPGQAQNTITSGQPIMGQPNQYMNTTGQGNQPFTYAQHNNGNGKGKG